MDIQFGMMHPREKAYYKGKIVDLRTQYEEQRGRFFKLDDESMKHELQMGDKEYDKLKGTMQSNSSKLIKQSDQLDRTLGLGMEAHQNLQVAHSELTR